MLLRASSDSRSRPAASRNIAMRRLDQQPTRQGLGRLLEGRNLLEDLAGSAKARLVPLNTTGTSRPRCARCRATLTACSSTKESSAGQAEVGGDSGHRRVVQHAAGRRTNPRPRLVKLHAPLRQDDNGLQQQFDALRRDRPLDGGDILQRRQGRRVGV